VATAFLQEMMSSLDGGVSGEGEPIVVEGRGSLPSYFDVTGLATASIGAAGLLLAKLSSRDSDVPPRVCVDQRLASHWFGMALRPSGWELPSVWDDLAGVFQANDGWIRLHTNAPAHRAAALVAVGCDANRAAVEAAVSGWSAEALESAVVAAGGCAAVMRSIEQWHEHPQGRAVAQTPLVLWKHVPIEAKAVDSHDPSHPLAGVRVLDLTRVLAGPVGSRFLAAYGAEVLRIDPPQWDEPGVVPEVTLGKRCAGLDLKNSSDRKIFEGLLRGADVFLHGYWADALAGLGYDDEVLRNLNPDLIDVSLNAYGWAGEWRNRRGFDSLVQMSSGIADLGMKESGTPGPKPLPVQALDHATGYLLAASVLSGLLRRGKGEACSAKLSLARVAHLLIKTRRSEIGSEFAPAADEEIDPRPEETAWGPARRVRWPLEVEETRAAWPYPATRLRSARPEW